MAIAAYELIDELHPEEPGMPVYGKLSPGTFQGEEPSHRLHEQHDFRLVRAYEGHIAVAAASTSPED